MLPMSTNDMGGVIFGPEQDRGTTMNYEQRDALVDELTALVAQGSDNPYAVMNARAKVVDILRRADPEPDGDAVESVADLFYRAITQAFGEGEGFGKSRVLKYSGPTDEHSYIHPNPNKPKSTPPEEGLWHIRNRRELAREFALQVAGSDVDWLDEALPGEFGLFTVYRWDDGEFTAEIRDMEGNIMGGSGGIPAATAAVAILNAIAAAKSEEAGR